MNDLAEMKLAAVGDGEDSVTSEVQVYEFNTYPGFSFGLNYIVFDTPGLGNNRGR